MLEELEMRGEGVSLAFARARMGYKLVYVTVPDFSRLTHADDAH